MIGIDLRIEGLTKRYGGVTALHRFDAVVPRGRISCVMGPSGCGKTTLLRILMGLETPDEGGVAGLERERVSAVFQEDRLCENLSAVSNVRLTCTLGRAEASAALADAGLGSSLDQPVRELSGGMRRRVAVMRALLADYSLLLLDEPFKGLDQSNREQMLQLVSARTAGRTVVLVSHDPWEAERLGARVIPMQNTPRGAEGIT